VEGRDAPAVADAGAVAEPAAEELSLTVSVAAAVTRGEAEAVTVSAPVRVGAADWEGAAVTEAVPVPSDALGVAVAGAEGNAVADRVPPPPDALPDVEAVSEAEALCRALAVAHGVGGADSVALPGVAAAVAVSRCPLPLGDALGAALRVGVREAPEEREEEGEGVALREGGGVLLEEPLGEARADASELPEGSGEADGSPPLAVGGAEAVDAPEPWPEADALCEALTDAASVGAPVAEGVAMGSEEGLAVDVAVGCAGWVGSADRVASAEGVRLGVALLEGAPAEGVASPVAAAVGEGAKEPLAAAV